MNRPAIRLTGNEHSGRHPIAEFQRAHALWHFRAFAQAIPILENLVLEHPRHPITELGGGLLLDALEHGGQKSRLAMWLDLLVHLDGFLDDKPQLSAIVRGYRRRYRIGPTARNENRG